MDEVWEDIYKKAMNALHAAELPEIQVAGFAKFEVILLS